MEIKYNKWGANKYKINKVENLKSLTKFYKNKFHPDKGILLYKIILKYDSLELKNLQM